MGKFEVAVRCIVVIHREVPKRQVHNINQIRHACKKNVYAHDISHQSKFNNPKLHHTILYKSCPAEL